MNTTLDHLADAADARAALERFVDILNSAREAGVIVEWSLGPDAAGRVGVKRFEVFRRVQQGH